MVALPILKSGCCWRARSGHLIRAVGDKWIPNYSTNAIMRSVKDDVREVSVAELINQELHSWRSDLIMEMFEKEDATICKIQLSRRYVEDSIVWLHNKKGVFTVKSTYKVAREVMRGGNVAESSRGCVGKRVWAAIWKLRISNKIKVFCWRACNEILPTKMNLTNRKVTDDAACPICMRFPEIAIHVLWECDAA